MDEKINMQSKDILSENIKNIVELFPNTLVETEEGKKIDFDILRQELSKDIVEGSKERYHLDFPGKREAIVEANRKTNKTLRPIKEKSVDFENTKNIYIEGDNLEALKILQESYLGKIKCIYIDPPYNTGNDFVYNDKFSHTTEEELKASGRMDEDGNILISKDINNDSNGRYHSDWLKMMYPRLKLARNLLSDNGVIFISIDDNEVNNLRKMCDEIFGENNFVALCPRKTRGSATTKSDAEIQKLNDYVLIYWKNKTVSQFNLKFVGEKEYPLNDERGKFYIVPLQDNGPHGTRTARPNLYYPIYYDEKNNIFSLNKNSDNTIEILPAKHKNDDGRWMWSKNKFESDNKDLYYKNEKVYIKHYYNENEDQNKYQRVKNWLEEFQNSKGTICLNELYEVKGLFDNPKPLELVKMFVEWSINEEDIVLDFFSGSATTAHAVMKLNAEDGGNRQFILVQLPEATDEGGEAYKAGYKTICDIGEERIRRAGKKIKEENPMLTQNLDIGFRVYKIDTSNMKDIYYTPNEISQNDITSFVSSVKEDRSAEDLLTQVILNLGLPLDLHIEEKKIGENKVFFVEDNALVACFDEKVDIKILDEIAKVAPFKICLRESSFEKDQDKINFFEKLKKLSPDTEATII